MMTITDTQILSYYYKGAAPLPESPILISSITAAEFLLIQSASPNRANYYPILPTYLKHGMLRLLPMESAHVRMLTNHNGTAAHRKRRTDQLILNFNGRMPSFIEFGGLAISQIINSGLVEIYSASISHLEKGLQRKLQDKLQFLIQAQVQCLAVTPAIADVGMNIFGQFLDRYEAKDNTRNTINDMLILATAVEHSLPLFTQDGLLKRFTAEIFGASCFEHPNDRIIIDFASPDMADRRKPFESKGYINRGWDVLQRRRNR